jgi:hypothetical protein
LAGRLQKGKKSAEKGERAGKEEGNPALSRRKEMVFPKLIVSE